MRLDMRRVVLGLLKPMLPRSGCRAPTTTGAPITGSGGARSHPGNLEALVATAREVMENACVPVVELAVPLVADAGIADNWMEAH